MWSSFLQNEKLTINPLVNTKAASKQRSLRLLYRTAILLLLLKEQLADQGFAADFEKTYKVPCAVAVHRKAAEKMSMPISCFLNQNFFQSRISRSLPEICSMMKTETLQDEKEIHRRRWSDPAWLQDPRKGRSI